MKDHFSLFRKKPMNRLYSYMILIFAVAAGCTAQKKIVKIEPEKEAGDSTSYELIITEPGFESWFATNRKPIWYYDHTFYRRNNDLMVKEWNNRVTSPDYGEPYDFVINYDPKIDYGIDLDFKLYWYFKFIEHKYNTRFLNTERK